jgi:hypothetical protein
LTLTIDGVTSAVFTLTVAENTGDGSPENPFKVATAADLAKVGRGADGWTLAAHYTQTANITLSGTWTPIGDNTNRFTGTYNGCGYSVSNLTINSPSVDEQGLFGVIGTGGAVRNLALTSVSIAGKDATGGVAGFNYGTIQNCFVTGNISGSNIVGGVAGFNNGTVENCYSACNVTGSGSGVGGVVGENFNMVENCYATGNITGNSMVGGVVGTNTGSGGTLKNCIALNKEVMATSNATFVGRVTGRTAGTLTNNHARETGMTLTANGVNVTVTPSATGVHGADATAANYNGASANTFWGGTLGFSSANWDIANGRLPHLRTTSGGNFSQNQTVAVTP